MKYTTLTKTTASVVYDLFMGIKSRFPICCVVWYCTTTHKERVVGGAFGIQVLGSGYVPCPKCRWRWELCAKYGDIALGRLEDWEGRDRAAELLKCNKEILEITQRSNKKDD